eukprot:10204225-Alexandrium_andersonii.AAC.1
MPLSGMSAADTGAVSARAEQLAATWAGGRAAERGSGGTLKGSRPHERARTADPPQVTSERRPVGTSKHSR